jgi:hypothetical protein
MAKNFTGTITTIIFFIGYFVTGIPLRIYYYSHEPSYRYYTSLAIVKLAIEETAKSAVYNAKFMLPIMFIVDIIILCLK